MPRDKHRKVAVTQGNGFPLLRIKILPNDPCPCKSGKKAKHCCGAKSEYFYSRLNEKQKAEAERERKRKEEEQKQKEEVKI